MHYLEAIARTKKITKISRLLLQRLNAEKAKTPEKTGLKALI